MAIGTEWVGNAQRPREGSGRNDVDEIDRVAPFSEPFEHCGGPFGGAGNPCLQPKKTMTAKAFHRQIEAERRVKGKPIKDRSDPSDGYRQTAIRVGCSGFNSSARIQPSSHAGSKMIQFKYQP